MLSACFIETWPPCCTASASWLCSWTPSPAMKSRSGTTARVPSRKVTTTSCFDSGLRETKNQPHTSEGIMAIPAACRNVNAVTFRDAPWTPPDGIVAGTRRACRALQTDARVPENRRLQAPCPANLPVRRV